MDYICLKARAKINIALDILGKRSDGYHDMRMIMQSIHLYDDVFIKKTFTDSVILECNIKRMPVDDRNLAYKAADYLLKEFDIKHGVYIQLTKHIPVSAGLGGGSSDCAAVLLGMRRVFKLPISNDELMSIGKRFGADVPFCMVGGTMLAEGIGDVLTRLGHHPPVYVLLAKPPVGLSTATVFGAYDPAEIDRHPDIDLLISHINNKDVAAIAKNFCNVLEPAAIKLSPMIEDLKKIMQKNNAYGQSMSGSGPTVYGYFSNKRDCFDAMHEIRTELPSVRELLLTRI